MQSSIDADYISHLGADPAKVFVTGNTKFDQTYAEVTAEDLAAHKTELGLGEDAYPVIVAGSTHPLEEDAVLLSFRELRNKYPQARLIIAPRKPARAGRRYGAWQPVFGYANRFPLRIERPERQTSGVSGAFD